MKRRMFLRAATAVIPAAGLHDLLESHAQGQVAVSPRAPELHVVGAGEDRYGQYHSMGISHLLFKVSGNETGGGMFVLGTSAPDAGRSATAPALEPRVVVLRDGG